MKELEPTLETHKGRPRLRKRLVQRPSPQRIDKPFGLVLGLQPQAVFKALFQSFNADVRQRCVGRVIGTSNERLSIGLLIAVIGSSPITGMGSFSRVVSQGERGWARTVQRVNPGPCGGFRECRGWFIPVVNNVMRSSPRTGMGSFSRVVSQGEPEAHKMTLRALYRGRVAYVLRVNRSSSSTSLSTSFGSTATMGS